MTTQAIWADTMWDGHWPNQYESLAGLCFIRISSLTLNRRVVGGSHQTRHKHYRLKEGDRQMARGWASHTTWCTSQCQQIRDGIEPGPKDDKEWTELDAKSSLWNSPIINQAGGRRLALQLLSLIRSTSQCFLFSLKVHPLLMLHPPSLLV